MSAHVWVDTGLGTDACRRIEDRYRVFQCAHCAQELWHYYDISWSPRQAAMIENVPEACRLGRVRLVTHRQVQLHMAMERREQRRKRWWSR